MFQIPVPEVFAGLKNWSASGQSLIYPIKDTQLKRILLADTEA